MQQSYTKHAQIPSSGCIYLELKLLISRIIPADLVIKKRYICFFVAASALLTLKNQKS
jgi:hypothetical protein